MRPLPNPMAIAVAREVLARAQNGDPGDAIRRARSALPEMGDPAMLHALIGMIACRSGDTDTGIHHLRIAIGKEPADSSSRANLVQALIDTGAPDEALALCDPESAARDGTLRLWRLRAWLAADRGERDAAVAAYLSIVAAAPRDHEAWNNLGNLLSERGDGVGAVLALGKATALRPDIVEIRLNHALSVASAGREAEAARLLEHCTRDFPAEARAFGELGTLLGRLHEDDYARRMLERAVLLAPGDPALHVRLGERHFALLNPPQAEHAFNDAIRLDPACGDAHVQLANLYEHTNRVADLAALAVEAARRGVASPALDFVRALDHRRGGRFQEALSALTAVPEDFEPGRRAHILGQCLDRLGRTDAAFDAFVVMNRSYATDPTGPLARAAASRHDLARRTALLTPDRIAGWRHPDPGEDMRSPVFLLGFPRSGTTLLDTMLMGHPGVTVMEELPALRMAEQSLGGADLSQLDAAAIHRARSQYLEQARQLGGWDGRTLLVDKLPLHLNKAELIHRLFPDARFLLALRHPCDVVLSCFITTFKLNDAMASFLDLRSAAEAYDLSFGHWQRCRELLPLDVHSVRYEDVILDTEAALRPVFGFLGLDWHDDALRHQDTARARAHITTASYAQVTEPIYARASGRWRRYERHLAPVLPLLAPWVERHGYTM